MSNHPELFAPPAHSHILYVCMSHNTCAIHDRTFVNAAEHLLRLVNEMRTSVNGSRRSLMAEMQGDEGAADCLIWRNASKEYKQQALELDDQMRVSIFAGKVSKRMLKEVIKVCHRGQRQNMYAKDADKHNSLADAVKSFLCTRLSRLKYFQKRRKSRYFISHLYSFMFVCLFVCLSVFFVRLPVCIF
jgi:hypothetical protein